MFHCHKCAAQWESERFQPAFREECPQCEADVHCCRNCRFHDPGAHNGCTVPTTEWVTDREKANLCEDFEMKTPDDGASFGGDQQKAREDLGRLFGEDSDNTQRPSTFDDLFGD